MTDIVEVPCLVDENISSYLHDNEWKGNAKQDTLPVDHTLPE